jgi:hypothetical protein
MKMLKIAGLYKSDGTIDLETGRSLNWSDLSHISPPELPPYINLEISISIKENDLLLGRGGIVWATLDIRQAEIIQSTLLAQHINSEVKTIPLTDNQLYILKIVNETDINDAIDFIWQSQSGLRLRPDWVYPEGEQNRSFEQWLGEQ